MRILTSAAGIALALSVVGTAQAAPIRLDGFTAPIQNVSFAGSTTPVGRPNTAGASGFNMTDVNGTLGLGSFVAWCLDVQNWLMGVGKQDDYFVTTTPFSNSFGLSTAARSLVQDIFNANYGVIDIGVGDQAAAFQMALWEAVYEDPTNGYSVGTGDFRVSSSGSNTLANTYLVNALNWSGADQWNLTFLQNSDPDPDRVNGQNLVTATPIPLPAAGWLMLAGIGGLIAARRRRS